MTLNFLLLLIGLSTVFVQQTENIHEIRFESITRGYQKTLIVRPDSIILHEQDPRAENIRVKRKTENAEWQQLTKAVSGLSLTAIPELDAPGMKRASDRALHSTLTIKTDKGEYKSREFDDYHPHKKLMPLVERIREIENNTRPDRN